MTAVRPDEIAPPVTLELSAAERAWVARQQKKAARAAGGKYIRHQSRKERARRQRQQRGAAIDV